MKRHRQSRRAAHASQLRDVAPHFGKPRHDIPVAISPMAWPEQRNLDDPGDAQDFVGIGVLHRCESGRDHRNVDARAAQVFHGAHQIERRHIRPHMPSNLYGQIAAVEAHPLEDGRQIRILHFDDNLRVEAQRRRGVRRRRGL